MPAMGGAPARSQPPAGLPEAVTSGPGAARFGKALDALKPEGRAATRGAKEVQVYQAASRAVVLVVSDDSFGSGVLVGSDGRIVTNLHVVGEADEVGVIFKPKTEGAEVSEADVRTAKVIRRDEIADLALLQVSEVPEGVAPLALGSAAAVQVGSDVHAIGHPTGEAWTYTRGIVSQIRKDYAWEVEDGSAYKATVIQTQTPINPGNSGGPLIDDNLQIIGINSFKGEGEGLNFAVSADDVKAFLERTGDRRADVGAQAKIEKKTCELKVLKKWRSDEDDADEFAMDEDCDGKLDYVLIQPDKKREPLVLVWDDDGDGVLDSMYVDEGRDGDFDLALFDTDNDGEPDLRGEFRKGEDEPFRYEKIGK